MGGGPLYPPADVERLARAGKYWAPPGIVTKMTNRGVDANDKIVELLGSLSTAGRHHKRAKLEDGVNTADVYIVRSEEDGYEWYVKFYIDSDGEICVLSCKWHGAGIW